MNKRLAKQTIVLSKENIAKLGLENYYIQILNNDYLKRLEFRLL